MAKTKPKSKLKPKQYSIKTVEDMFKIVTKTNIENFLSDFKMIAHSWLLFKAVAKQNKLKKHEFNPTSFIWIDDNKKQITLNLRAVKKSELNKPTKQE